MKRQAVKKLIQCVAIIAAGVLAIILFMLAIWYRGKNSEGYCILGIRVTDYTGKVSETDTESGAEHE